MKRIEAISTADPSEWALELVTEVIRASVAERGRCLLSLSGGRTPQRLYLRLARMPELPWSAVHVYWGDERFVPPEHAASNAGAARSILLDHVAIPPEQIHPWPILSTPQNSARAYAQLLTETAGDPPRFDLTLLGLGADCHTASLFPGSGALAAPGLTVASRPASASEPRLSLTAAALSGSRTVLFIVMGEEKRDALARLLVGQADPEECPARAVSALERLLLVTDQPLPAGTAGRDASSRL
jgi:6-phosphogluconolactonase